MRGEASASWADDVSAIVDALLAELDDDALDALAESLAPRLAARLGQVDPVPWLDVAAAAAYLTCPKSRIYALVSARRIPHHKDGSRVLFRYAELDDWVRRGGGKRP
jgi:excisionase family DNA binding protein